MAKPEETQVMDTADSVLKQSLYVDALEVEERSQKGFISPSFQKHLVS